MNIFTLTGTILVDSAKAEQSISKTGDKAEGLGKKLSEGIKTAGKWAAGITTAAAAVGGAMIAAAKDTAAEMDVVDKASQRMGIAAESYQELAYAAGLSGVEMSTLEKAAKKLEGTDLNMDDALAQIYELGTAEERASKAAELFGDSIAYSMTPMLNASAEDMAAMKQEAHDLGLVMSDEMVASGASLGDMFSKVEQSVGALKNSLLEQLMPYISEILQWVLDNMPVIQETVGKVMDAIWPIVKTVLDLIMKALPPLLKAVEGVIGLLDGDIQGFVDGMVNLFKELIPILFDLGKDIFTSLWDGIKNIWSSISNWVSEKVSWLTDKLAFWRKGSSEMDAQTDGSHAAGLPVVPYDGYVAELHRGESVMNAGAVSELTNAIKKLGNQQSGAPAQPISVQLNLDSVTLAQLLVDPLRKAQQFNGGNYISMGGSAV